MTIEHRVGDLFAQADLRALCQGVNCQGVMGSGIAPVFKRYWPDMYAEYRDLCRDGQLTVGGLHAWQTPKGNWIYNLASQHRTGKDARLDAIEAALTKALDHAATHDVPIVGIPRIGAGIGGLNWAQVREVLHLVAEPSPTHLVVVSQPRRYPVTRYERTTLRAIDEELDTLIGSFLWESPNLQRDAAIGNRCGPIAFAFAVYLRANSLPGGLIHVTGEPQGFTPHTGHYMATSQRWVIDFAYRQFDPTAPLPVIYERADLDAPQTWHPWVHISGELESDDPLYPDFVEYAANTDPLAYLAPGTDDPEWVTPYDER